MTTWTGRYVSSLLPLLLVIGCSADSTDDNVPPLADAGEPIEVPVGVLVTLDGSASVDPDGSSLTFRWSFQDLPPDSALTDADLSDATTVGPTFTPDVAGRFTVALIVSDGLSDSDPGLVEVSAGPPVADAGVDQLVDFGEVVSLDGSASALHGGGNDGLAYHWAFVSVPPHSALTDAEIVGGTEGAASFTPDASGEYVVELVVSDEALESAADTLTVRVMAPQPTADAGQDQSLVLGSTFTLDGSSSSSADGASLSYRWSFLIAPVGSAFSGEQLEDSATPSFVPDRTGAYWLELTVNNGERDSESDAVTVSAGIPLASTGGDRTVEVGTVVMLDGSSSTSFAGGALTYSWTLVSVPAASQVTIDDLSEPTVATPSFTPDVIGDYVFTLVVGEGVAESGPTTLTITASTLVSAIPFTDPNLAACVEPLGDYVSEVRSLGCNAEGIADLGGLEQLTSLRSLNLDANPISDISALSGLTGLGTFTCNYCLITDVSPLSSLTELTLLQLASNNITDVSGLATLTGLTTLALGDNSISDVSALAGLTNLTFLQLEGNPVSDISALSGMTALETLRMDGCDVADLAPLADLTSLTDLDLNSNNVTSVAPLAGLTALTDLDLQSNNVDDISALAGLTQLENLDLSNNAITDVSSLSGMTVLGALSLHSNAIADISPLADLTNLSLLYLGNNSISDVSPLAGMTNLIQLYLTDNAITDVSSLAALVSLLDLQLDNNLITTGVATLVSLTDATTIDLSGNGSIPCADLAILTAALPGVVTEPAGCL